MEQLTEILTREHQTVLGALDRLEEAIEADSRSAIEDALHFLDERLIPHRRKEEEVLFPELAKRFPPDAGPVVCMLEEHGEERRRLSALWIALGSHDRKAVVQEEQAVLDHLRGHIAKEETVLFPMAEALLEGDARSRVHAGFRSIGACCTECAVPTDAPKREFRSEETFGPY